MRWLGNASPTPAIQARAQRAARASFPCAVAALQALVPHLSPIDASILAWTLARARLKCPAALLAALAARVGQLLPYMKDQEVRASFGEGWGRIAGRCQLLPCMKDQEAQASVVGGGHSSLAAPPHVEASGRVWASDGPDGWEEGTGRLPYKLTRPARTSPLHCGSPLCPNRRSPWRSGALPPWPAT